MDTRRGPEVVPRRALSRQQKLPASSRNPARQSQNLGSRRTSAALEAAGLKHGKPEAGATGARFGLDPWAPLGSCSLLFFVSGLKPRKTGPF